MLNPVIGLLIGLGVLILIILLFWPNGGLIGYLQRFRQYSTRIRHEDALKHIHKTERHNDQTTLESLAGALGVNTNQAAHLLSDLQYQDLLTFDGEFFRLTPTGRDYALRIIRAHRLWERYLAEETGYTESDWHDIAERYEHQISPDQADALSAQLGNPTHDPHGDPIPTSNGELVHHGGQPLTVMEINMPLRIVHMEDEPETVYAQLVAEQLYPGMEVQITEKTSQRLRFWANGDEHLLAPIVAASISVVPIQQEIHEPPQIGESLEILQPGQKGQVVALSPGIRSAERRRMMDLGILPGTIIQAELNSPSGDPTAYRIRDALIALRREQAEFIRIKPLLEEIQ